MMSWSTRRVSLEIFALHRTIWIYAFDTKRPQTIPSESLCGTITSHSWSPPRRECPLRNNHHSFIHYPTAGQRSPFLASNHTLRWPNDDYELTDKLQQVAVGT